MSTDKSTELDQIIYNATLRFIDALALVPTRANHRTPLSSQWALRFSISAYSE